MNLPLLTLALRTSATILPAQLLPLLTPILDKGYLSHPEQPVPSLTRVASVQCFAVQDTPAPFQSPLPIASQPLTQEDQDPEELVLFSSICPPRVSNVLKKKKNNSFTCLQEEGVQGGRQAGLETELAL